MKALCLAPALFAALPLIPAQAQAKSQTQAQTQPRAACAPHDAVVARLAERYGEGRQSIGPAAGNTVAETFASPETGTWTITVTRAGGPTCLVAAGQAYQYLAEALPNTDPPA